MVLHPRRMDLQRVVKRAQREAGILKARQKVKRVAYQGIELRIDRPKGYTQTGKDAAGKEWSRTFKVDYGYIPRTKGGDGDGLDVYLGDDEDAQLAYWVSQRRPDGVFDEYKVMLGFTDRRSARAMWAAHTPEKFFGGIATTSMGMVKALLGIEPMSLHKCVGPMVFDDPTIEIRLDGAALAKALEDARILPSATSTDAAEVLVQKRTARGVERVAKAEEEQRYVLGVMLEPDIVDSQGDTYDAATIERAAHLYLTKFRNAGLMHQQLVNNMVELVESYIAPMDLVFGDVTIPKGTWLAAYKIYDDEIWAAVKSGELTGLSIGGTARKVHPVTGEPIPPPPDQARYQP